MSAGQHRSRRRPVPRAQARARPQVQQRGDASCGCWSRFAAEQGAGPRRADAGPAGGVPGVPATVATAQLQPPARRRSAACSTGPSPRSCWSASPLRPRRAPGAPRRASRSCSTAVQARRLLDAAAALPDNPRARGRGHDLPRRSSPCATGWGCAPARRAGCSLGDVDAGREPACRAGRQVRQEPPRPARAADRARSSPSRPAPPRQRADGRPRRAAVHLRRQAQRPSRHRQPDVPSARRRARAHRPRRRLAPDLHGLRHSFAVGCLLRWYREGCDPQPQAAPAVHVHGPRRPRLDSGLPDHHRRAAGRGQPPVRGLRRPAWTEVAR